MTARPFHAIYYLSATIQPTPRPFIWTDARIEVNSVNLSAFTHRVAFSVSADDVDVTPMNVTDYRRRIGRVTSWSVGLDFWADFATGATDASLNGLLGAVVSVKLRPTSAPIGPTNPEYSGLALVTEYPPMVGVVGEVAAAHAALKGSGALVRSVS